MMSPSEVSSAEGVNELTRECRVEIRIKDSRRIIIEFYGGR